MTLRQVIEDLREEGWAAARREMVLRGRWRWTDRLLSRLLKRSHRLVVADAAFHEARALVEASNRLLQRGKWEALQRGATAVDPRPGESFLRPLQATRSQETTSAKRRSWRR